MTLTKWYLDCVDDEGRTAIVYWTALTRPSLALSWHSVSSWAPGESPRHRSSLANVKPPEHRQRSITFASDALACNVSCEPRLAPFGRRLLDSANGAVDWRCEAGAARTRISLPHGATIRGSGYVESLALTVSPWRLPIEELRWGRWISADVTQSLVWIDWRGSHPLTHAFLDGAALRDGAVTGDAVGAGDLTLTLSDPHTLHARSLGDIVRTIPQAAALVPDSWLALRDCKWRSAGVLHVGDGPPRTGWAIHEHVRFP